MVRRQKIRARRFRRRVMTLGIILLFFLVLGLGRKFVGSLGKVSYASSAINEDGVLEMKPAVQTMVDSKLAELKQKDQELELAKIREEIREKNRLEGKFKVAYLTFDDGPSTKSTPKILDILKEEGVKATFFVQGQNVNYYPEIFKRIHDEGHAIGHHSYSHDYNYLYSSMDNFMSDIYKTERKMQEVLGSDFKTHLLRFPGGAFGSKKLKYAEYAASKGYINYNWNALNGDAEGHGLSSARLINRLKSTVGNQKEVVILMHDTNAKASTVESLPTAIKYLRDKGYEFRTLD